MFERPRHPYTVGLLASIPRIDTDMKADALRAIPGGPPAFGDLPPGCRFEPRCPLATAECGKSPVPLAAVGPDHDVACLHQATVAERGVLFGAGTPGPHRRREDDGVTAASGLVSVRDLHKVFRVKSAGIDDGQPHAAGRWNCAPSTASRCTWRRGR